MNLFPLDAGEINRLVQSFDNAVVTVKKYSVCIPSKDSDVTHPFGSAYLMWLRVE
jgi:hypothetical protein